LLNTQELFNYLQAQLHLRLTINNQYYDYRTIVNAGADWLQGPYVYALYKAYGFSQQQIGILFLSGFGSSMLFGLAVGTITDK